MAPYDHRDVAAAAGDRVDQRRPARGTVKDRRRDGERPEAGVTAHPRPERGLRGPRGPERRLDERLLPAIARPVAARRDPDPAQVARGRARFVQRRCDRTRVGATTRSEEHTSELQSQSNLVCRLLLEKKKKNDLRHLTTITPMP